MVDTLFSVLNKNAASIGVSGDVYIKDNSKLKYNTYCISRIIMVSMYN